MSSLNLNWRSLLAVVTGEKQTNNINMDSHKYALEESEREREKKKCSHHTTDAILLNIRDSSWQSDSFQIRGEWGSSALIQQSGRLCNTQACCEGFRGFFQKKEPNIILKKTVSISCRSPDAWCLGWESGTTHYTQCRFVFEPGLLGCIERRRQRVHVRPRHGQVGSVFELCVAASCRSCGC